MPTNWEDLNWIEFQKRVPSEFQTAIIPIGTVEAHGVAPLGTDNIIPIDLVSQIAGELKALVCPPIHYGQVRGLAGYPGSVSIDESVLLSYTQNVFCSIADWGFRNLIVINGHGGNTQTLKQAAWLAHSKSKIRIMVLDWWTLAYPVCEDVYGQSGGHAGCDETGYVMAIRPETIHPELYKKAMVFNASPAASLYPYPGPVITYKPGEGAPVFDAAKARQYRDGAIARVLDYCRSVLSQWQEMGI